MAAATKKKKSTKAKKPVAAAVEQRDDSWGAKHRPRQISDMLLTKGTAALLNSFLTKRPRSGVLLVTGPSGTGKTTIANILAEALSYGHAADVIHFDCSKTSGVENMRELLAETRYMPRSEKGSRVVLLDEIQALVGVGQDRALKSLLGPLEDKSAPIFWILCTDQPQVLPATILSRSQRIDLRAPKTEDVAAMLGRILKAEKDPIKWSAAEIASLCKAVAEASPLNIRMACNSLQTVVTQVQAMDLNSSKMTLKKAIAAGVEIGSNVAKAEVMAAGDLLRTLALPEKGFGQVCVTIKGAAPAFVIDALISAASLGAASDIPKGEAWANYCGMALMHLIEHKDAAYLRAGQTPVEQTARLQATLFKIYRESVVFNYGSKLKINDIFDRL